MEINLAINGETLRADVAPRYRLVDLIRREAGLTGTNVGCGQGVCGACTVLLDGQTVKSCLLFAYQAEGHQVTTIEGINLQDGLTEVQEALKRNFAIQCGYCAPGFVLAITQLLARYEDPSEDEIRYALEGNVCRCGGYVNMVRAVQDLAAARKGAAV
jgi:aerobic-type carbon monoxide dehydrogenase small subunit (CoxS/CutS family)